MEFLIFMVCAILIATFWRLFLTMGMVAVAVAAVTVVVAILARVAMSGGQ